MAKRVDYYWKDKNYNTVCTSTMNESHQKVFDDAITAYSGAKTVYDGKLICTFEHSPLDVLFEDVETLTADWDSKMVLA